MQKSDQESIPIESDYYIHFEELFSIFKKDCIFASLFKAINNKDYSVVKTAKGAEPITPSPFFVSTNIFSVAMEQAGVVPQAGRLRTILYVVYQVNFKYF